MANTGYFRELNIIVNTIISMILQNQELCKMIYYDVEEPLSQPDFTTSVLPYSQIFPLPKTPDAKIEKSTILNVYFEKAKHWKDNLGFKQEYLIIDIICHLDKWNMGNGELRPYSISQKLDEMLNDKYIENVSTNRVLFDGWDIMKYSDYHYGYRMYYCLTNNSNVENSVIKKLGVNYG